MNDNHISYKEKADNLFYWFEENIYSKEKGDSAMSVYFAFYDWLLDAENVDTVVDKSGLLGDFKDPDDAEEAANKLLKYILSGLDRFFDNGLWWMKQGEN